AIADDFGRKAVTRIHRQNRQARRDSVFYLLSKVKLTVPVGGIIAPFIAIKAIDLILPLS
ncbi:hypothetical protein, partial [Leptolyngbya sp. FACHB-541]|uniref:hypothetical protein n=1 Tax=Leptolyngbya sp. FACHB-541 TaxID=2692810 RepID=UPI001A7ECE82